MTKIETVKLEPCPFCGVSNVQLESDKGDSYYWVRCIWCEVCTNIGSKNKVIRLWNSRK